MTRIEELSRIEAKVDLLLKQANIKFDPYQNVSPDVTAAIREGKKIKAIKIYRQTTGCGLKEAKDYVEGAQRRVGSARG
jgi:ribosomal protein L7/L12